MAEDRTNDAFMDMEKELTCSICTDVLFQPLTLLDCLHTFCGSCLKEWFAWQATAATQSRRPLPQQPYTCPSCRESVRGTKADWRLTTLLEGFLKANPDKGKTEEEKEEMRKHYKLGEDVIPKVIVPESEEDSEDERLIAQVREMSMAGIDPEAARRRADHSSRTRGQRRGETQTRARGSGRSSGQREGTQQSMPLTEARLRERDGVEHHIEHQSSLRSLLSASPVDSHDVQQEILQSIYSEGLLDGIDLDNLTPEQEEELTERIAEAYRRRQRRRDRSNNRERGQQSSRSPQPPPISSSTSPESTERHRSRETSRGNSTPERRNTPPRSRPPISRPHVFEQATLEPSRQHRRNTSATSQRSTLSVNPPPTHTTQSALPIQQANRSATDLSDRPRTAEANQERRRRVSGNARSTTDPEYETMRAQAHRMRASSNNNRDSAVTSRPATSSGSPGEARPANINSSTSLVPFSNSTASATPQQIVRPVISLANFAPEPLSHAANVTPAPAVKCDRCNKTDIQYDLHYHCSWCRGGHFDLCLSCYRGGRGCEHWFGFGYMAYERWHRSAPPEGRTSSHERPHVLSPRRYVRHTVENPATGDTETLQEGAFCEICFSSANESYWYCGWCLEGAWGVCSTCLERGKHCTHPLLPIAHLNSLRTPASHQDPTKTSFINLPHLRQDSYSIMATPATDCDICHRTIPPTNTRFHCYTCSNGDYDICTECYHNLVTTGKISSANGPTGWRRCLQAHRMAIITHQDLPTGGQQRLTLRPPIGGWRLKDDLSSAPTALPPADHTLGMRCLASWSRFPDSNVRDELCFPKNAEIREVEEINSDWYLGVYAGAVGLFPSNHVRKL
ncbi:Hypothetical protein R9X50_00560900 [Acrodontium crateriforme]|uniref:RING-type domain-containing protein n=1 Tax=Acrodontium crateriforme TaxID=150365 RepID=A0AAQ3MA03_9PEZI|nr:Hypothetical protein R9X50_00560900 [Acrodontium crateriforme]